MKNTTELYGELLEVQNDLLKLTKKFNKTLEEKAKITEELNWFRVYGNYIGKVYNNVDAEACGFADGDEEYKENMENPRIGFYEINSLGIVKKIK
jgi:hypothetical protein